MGRGLGNHIIAPDGAPKLSNNIWESECQHMANPDINIKAILQRD